jgi:hypothetical protein
LGFSLLFFQAFREFPSSEAKPNKAADFFLGQTMFANDLPEELTKEVY